MLTGSLLALGTLPVQAATDCTFTTVGSTMFLDADCVTDATIGVPDGVTLDGRSHSITAVDPDFGHFLGPVVTNEGSLAYISNLVVQAQDLMNICDGGADRLRGIMFEGASGAIWQTTVQGINQGSSGCQEGSGIEVRKAPFDGSHRATVAVEISQNVIENYQKTGIVCNGDVVCDIHHNFSSESATQENLAANSVQLGFGATGTVSMNHIAGNQWLGPSNFVATAVLIIAADGVTIERNNIGGNSDVGLFLFGEGALVDNNRIFDGGPDGPHGDFGVFDFDSTSVVTNNRSGPRNLDSGLSEISIVFQAAVPKPVAPKYTTSGVRRPSEL